MTVVVLSHLLAYHTVLVLEITLLHRIHVALHSPRSSEASVGTTSQTSSRKNDTTSSGLLRITRCHFAIPFTKVVKDAAAMQEISVIAKPKGPLP